jgi:antitoxin ParD1/3/4
MSTALTPEQESFISQKIASGGYQSPTEVIDDALRLLRERDELAWLGQEELRKEIAAGIEQSQRGEVAPLDMEAIKQASRQRIADSSR